ncbi:monovalent cation/H(+) antiporter subunit G [Thalassobium sp. R2A62]|jgi:multicomponent K+:H+ antiporter subunit G|uniref:cation:proton antiporter n=1 Tax=Thalassobium sp. R2A62 TaxID=633131 RepID=UPI0001B1D2E4|nr:monovalent cation/H(+) antiporter subunit G [Thalassobium sp. R2A62]EET49441.1 monovalent cation/proton antiporter, MnhG/PhaG subunit [Thalassobium sp. R2A62]MDG1340519.1 monovalent cation/H(+) antiporter subunit G [Paracoccaceae bacterium]MDG2451573.1 monovalent cation/H(+) antiporter subunit G [Paracoccaceae bacterium]
MSILFNAAAVICLFLGTIFMLVAAIGLIKLNTPMARVHAPTKAGTVGVGAFLFASILSSFANGNGSLNELLIMAFLFVTAPVSAHFIAKVNIHKGACVTPPDLDGDALWSTLNVPEEDRDIQEQADV